MRSDHWWPWIYFTEKFSLDKGSFKMFWGCGRFSNLGPGPQIAAPGAASLPPSYLPQSANASFWSDTGARAGGQAKSYSPPAALPASTLPLSIPPVQCLGAFPPQNIDRTATDPIVLLHPLVVLCQYQYPPKWCPQTSVICWCKSLITSLLAPFIWNRICSVRNMVWCSSARQAVAVNQHSLLTL